MLVLGQIIITKKPLNILLPLKTEYLYILPVFYSAHTNFRRHFTWALRHIIQWYLLTWPKVPTDIFKKKEIIVKTFWHFLCANQLLEVNSDASPLFKDLDQLKFVILLLLRNSNPWTDQSQKPNPQRRFYYARAGSSSLKVGVGFGFFEGS